MHLSPDDNGFLNVTVLSNKQVISSFAKPMSNDYTFNEGHSVMVFSKYFYDRPSAQGFKRGLGINI
jgi:hypothetical protein